MSKTPHPHPAQPIPDDSGAVTAGARPSTDLVHCLACGCWVTPIFTRRAGEQRAICRYCGSEDTFASEADR